MGIIWSTLTLPIRTSTRLVLFCISLVFTCIRLAFVLLSLSHLFTYLGWVTLTVLGLGLALDDAIGRQLVQTLPVLAKPVGLITAIFLDTPQNVVAAKVFVLLTARLFGVMGYWLGWLVMLVDLASTGVLLWTWQANLRQVESLDVDLSLPQLLARSCWPVYRPAAGTVSVFKDVSIDVAAATPDRPAERHLVDVYTTSFDDIAADAKPVVLLVQRNRAAETIPLILAERGLVVVSTSQQGMKDTLAWTRETIRPFGGSRDDVFVVMDVDGPPSSTENLSGIVYCRPNKAMATSTVPHLTLVTGDGAVQKQTQGDDKGTTIALRTGGSSTRVHGIGSVLTGEVIAKWILRVQSQGRKGQ